MTVSLQATFFDPVKQVEVPVPADVEPLFRPLKVGSLQLSHRIVMAPLTRSRAIGRVPTPAMATYYGQRASKGGLIIAEATIVTASGAGYAETPGIHTDEQEAAWRPVTDAVHAKGGLIVLQLWHVGRQSHSDFQPGNALPVSSSATLIPEPWSVNTPAGGGTNKPFETPRALEVSEIKEMVKTYAAAAKRAMSAGFDGVEVHGAHGYLLDQFTKDSCNKRTDDYGGCIENRARFTLEVTTAVVEAVGDAGRVGIRISPFSNLGDAIDSTPYTTHTYLVEQLKKLNLAYVHMTEARVDMYPVVGPTTGANAKKVVLDSLLPFRITYGGLFMADGDYQRANAVEAIRSGACDLVAFGRPFISSPDLPARLLADVNPNKWNRSTFYTQDQVVGYTDYPFMEAKL